MNQRGLPGPLDQSACSAAITGAALRTGAWGSIRRLSSRCAWPCRRSSGSGEKLPAIGQMGCTGYARINAAFPAARSARARRPGLPAYRCMGLNSPPVLTVRLVLPAVPGPGEKLPAIGQVGCAGYARINAALPPLTPPRARARYRRRHVAPSNRPVPRAASRAHAAGQGRLSPRLRCSPGGSPPRASRGPRRLTPWLRSSGCERRASRGAPLAAACGAFAPGRRRPQAGLPVALRSAPQADRRCTQPPRQPVGAGVAPGAKRRLSRRLHKAAGLSRRSHAPPGVLPGGLRRPRAPRPPAAGGPRAAAPAAGHARYGHPGRAARPGAEDAPGVAPQPGHPTRAWLQHRPGAPARHSRAPPPAWGAVVRPAAAPGLASRSLLAPAAAGRRGPPAARARPVRGPRLARRAGAARAGTAAGARLAGRSLDLVLHLGQCLGPRPGPIAGGARPPQARQARGTGPPLDPPTERLRRAARCTPAQPGPVPSGLRPAGAGVLPAAHRWPRGQCLSCGPFVRPGLAPLSVPRPARPWLATASTPLASLRAAARPAAPGV